MTLLIIGCSYGFVGLVIAAIYFYAALEDRRIKAIPVSELALGLVGAILLGIVWPLPMGVMLLVYFERD